MVFDTSPWLRIMQLSQPTFENGLWNVLDISDAIAVGTNDEETAPSATQNVMLPMLTIPPSGIDALVGQDMHGIVVFGNNTSTHFKNVSLLVCNTFKNKFQVDITFDFAPTSPQTVLEAQNIELLPRCKPMQKHFDFVPSVPARYKLRCILNYTINKHKYKVDKHVNGNCVNPLRVNNVLHTLPNGTSFVACEVTNIHKNTLSIKEIALVHLLEQNQVIEAINQRNVLANCACILRPNNKHSVLFKVDDVSEYELRILWNTPNTKGKITLPVNAEIANPDANFYKYTIQSNSPDGMLQVNKGFEIAIDVTNQIPNKVHVYLLFNHDEIRPLFIQASNRMQLGVLEYKQTTRVVLDSLCTNSGIYEIRGIELVVGNRKVPIGPINIKCN